MIGLLHNWLVVILTGIFFTEGRELFAFKKFPILDVFMIYGFNKNFINTRKAFKKLYIFILRRFGLILIHLQSKK